jgi:hypothetical protein
VALAQQIKVMRVARIMAQLHLPVLVAAVLVLSVKQAETLLSATVVRVFHRRQQVRLLAVQVAAVRVSTIPHLRQEREVTAVVMVVIRRQVHLEMRTLVAVAVAAPTQTAQAQKRAVLVVLVS